MWAIRFPICSTKPRKLPRPTRPLAASILLAVACSTLVAALLAYPVRKLRGIFLAIATVGFGEIVRVIINNQRITGGAEGLSGIPNDVPPRSMFSGYPAGDNRQWLKTVAALNRLPELQKRVRELEAELERLGGHPRTSASR